ncbi:MAG: PAS domain S-box protein, partial [Methanomicrobiales archaeon]|nr:PAS domain S-box protein [Methanomicrobiales archaeon]
QNETALVKKSEELIAAYDELTAAGEELKAQFDALTNSERMVRESEGRVLSIIHSMQFGIIIIDAETHTILEVNQKALEMIGVGNGAVVGMVCHRFICPAESGRCPVTDLGQMVDSSERLLLTMRGDQVPILKSVIKTVLGGKEVLIESFIDITERKVAEDELKESRERFRQLAEVFPETIFEADTNGSVTYANKHGLEQFGYTEEDFSNGLNLSDLVSPGDRDKVFLRVKKKVRGNDSDYLEYQALRKDGSTFWVMGLSVPIMVDGITVGLRGFLLDITERKLLESEMRSHEQELMQLSTSLAAANKKLNILSGITRHDINNQLTILMGYLGMLEEMKSDPALDVYFVTINTAAERIATMVQFTKEYEQIGVSAPAWQNCRTLVDTAATKARTGRVMVKNDLPAGAEMFADPLVVKVFYNIMGNAVRYGGKITTIRFSVLERDGDHVIVCEDDGVGIPAEEKEKIFERGFGKNTGLGLALSREILDITGITIRETGEPGKGARFEMAVSKGSYRSALPNQEFF